MSGRAAVAAARLEMHFSDEFVSLGPVPSPCHIICPICLLEWAAAPCWLPHTPYPILDILGMEGKEDKEEEVVVTWYPLLFPSHCPSQTTLNSGLLIQPIFPSPLTPHQ